ncbi:MAG: hypothetical protein PHN39_01030 [Candidatus Pacebacteria bacterium]|nr:hypothetical protein [Candidatus Paceibacterota bacterium]
MARQILMELITINEVMNFDAAVATLERNTLLDLKEVRDFLSKVTPSMPQSIELYWKHASYLKEELRDFVTFTSYQVEHTLLKEEATMNWRNVLIVVAGIIVLGIFGKFLVIDPAINKAVTAMEKTTTSVEKMVTAKDQIMQDLGNSGSDLRKHLNSTFYSAGYQIAEGGKNSVRQAVVQAGNETGYLFDKDNKLVVIRGEVQVDADGNPNGDLATAKPSATIQALDQLAGRYGFTIKKAVLPKTVVKPAVKPSVEESADTTTEEGATDTTKEKPAAKPKAKTSTGGKGKSGLPF